MAGIALMVAGPSGCSEEVTRNVAATVLFVEGPVLISRSAGREFLPLQSGAHAGKGAMIETAASSHAALALLPNILVQLDPGTRIEIVRLALAKDGHRMASAMRGRYAEVKLLSGRIFVSHDWGEANAQFTVATAQGNLVTSSNALFVVQSDSQHTRVTCVTGRVGFRPSNADAATPIPPGHLGDWSPVASTVIAADTDARGQADLEETLDVEPKLRALRDQMRNVPPAQQGLKIGTFRDLGAELAL
jgi:hypothetical protein